MNIIQAREAAMAGKTVISPSGHEVIVGGRRAREALEGGK